MNQMAKYSNIKKFEAVDFYADHVATILKQDIVNNYQQLQLSAGLVARENEWTKDGTKWLLPILAQGKTYEDIAIVDSSGIGYNLAGDEVNFEDEDYFINAMNGQSNSSNKIDFTVDQNPVITYAVPIIENGTNKGVIVASVSSKIDFTDLFQSELDEESRIYIVNDKNELIAYAQDTDIASFDYNSIIKNGVFLNDIKTTETNELYDLYGKESIKSKYIWASKPLGINDWSILVRRPNIDSNTTKEILRLTNMMWIYITLGTVILCTIMILFRRKANHKVMDMLYLDPVTGGDNWYKFRISVNKILNSKQYTKKRFAIINFDINRFKIINDAYGYHKGDEVLKDIYEVIEKWVKPGEPFTRYAADQFYILMSFQEEEEVTERINDLNDRLHQLRYTSSARIFYGVYYITERQDSIDRMGEFAGIAKSNIKGNAEGIMSFFDDAARERLLEEEEIEKSMNEALKNDEFQVYLQPKYTAKEETISGAEALVRWFNSEGRVVPPGFFIPVFEKNGFITELDYYMLRKVCEVIRGWLHKGYTPLPISVNISRLHFANPHLAEIIKDIVDNYGVPHNLIELELTESAFLQNKQALIRTVTQLRKYGFLVSMDDFGAGYSSLNSLKDLPLDVVKLDGELFRLTNEVERGLTVIRNTITMAKDLHMKVVAECIETREQVEFLCNVGCDIIQGYYFAKPMSIPQFEERYFSFVAID